MTDTNHSEVVNQDCMCQMAHNSTASQRYVAQQEQGRRPNSIHGLTPHGIEPGIVKYGTIMARAMTNPYMQSDSMKAKLSKSKPRILPSASGCLAIASVA